MKKLKFILLFIFIFSLSACMQAPEGNKRASQTAGIGSSFGGSGGSGIGSGNSGANPGDGNLDGSGDEPMMSAKVEIRHLVDPITGTYTRKLTVPKNFSGFLYLSGLNISSLSDRHIKVRFNFGREREPITVPAVVARGPGITPSTDIEVLVMNMNSKPFEGLKLLYDLFDYSEYDFDEMDEDGFVIDDPTDVPVTNNRHRNLYCRGLNLEDDSTFAFTSANPHCDQEDQECLYAYAKIRDRGLFNLDLGVPTFPSLAQIDQEGLGYFSDDSQNLTKRCLPDNAKLTYDGELGEDATLFLSESIFFAELGAAEIIGQFEYMYMGPYASLNKSIWQIKEDAVIGAKGLFRDSLSDTYPLDYGHISLLFPRYSKRNLNAGVEHLSSTRPNGYKDVLPFPNAGKTEWMDGCNERVVTMDQNQEHIGSCTVTATIEIWATDPDTGNDILIAGRNDGGKEVKLQLVKASTTNSVGQEVLYSALTSCQNSNGCGSGECCYNSRCWSKDIVSQCIEDTAGTGLAPVGATCQTDFDCSSLCCNKASGKCSVHDTTSNPPVLCSKPSGQMCIAKEWCQQEPIQECFIVKTGTDAGGNVTCQLRCYNRLRHGDCLNGICTPPIAPSVPLFNPNDPNRCDDAIDPPLE
jgi:hypothetical protein